MRAYIKLLPAEKPLERGHFDLDRQHLSFPHFLHKSTTELLDGIPAVIPAADRPRLLADIASSIVAQLGYRGYLRQQFVSRALRYCNRMIEDLGYVLRTDATLAKDLDPRNRYVMLVPGCQTVEILHSRVECAYKVLGELRHSFKIVFSGRNPIAAKTGGRAAILHEAEEMCDYFNVLLRRDANSAAPLVERVDVEGDSRTTNGNVQSFFDAGFLQRDESCTVFLVTSLFHLPRLAAAFEAEVLNRNAANVESIVLVGSEAADENHSAKRHQFYLKSLAFTVLEHSLRTTTADLVPHA